MSKRSKDRSSAPPAARQLNLQAAIQALQMQRPDETERIASAIAASETKNVLALQLWGHALLIQNRPGEAVRPLESAIGVSDEPAIATLLAAALAGSGRQDEALALLGRTAARRPLYPPACLEYSAQLSKGGRLDEATAALENGLVAAPGSAELRLELGFHHLRRNARAKARATFEQIVTAHPDRTDAVAALAKVLAMDGKYIVAAEAYRRVLAQHPNDMMARNNLAICLLEAGDRAAGEMSLRDVVRGVPQMAGQAMSALASASHGRFFLRPSGAAAFLRNAEGSDV